MILEHRTYTFKPGTVEMWLKKYQTEGLPIQRRHRAGRVCLNSFA